MEFSHNFSHTNTQHIIDVIANPTAIPKEHFQGASSRGRATGAIM